MKERGVMIQPARSNLSLSLGLILAATAMTADLAHAAEERPVVFACEGLSAVEARFGDEVVQLALEGEAVELPQLPSGSGARYGDGEIEFWTKGDEATLTRSPSGVETPHACRIQRRQTLLEEAVSFTGAMMFYEFQAPALVFGVARGGEKAVAGYGELRPGTGAAPDGGTVMRIGSITKTFTAATLAGLAAEGTVALTDRLEDHLDWDVKVPSREGRPIRLWHLATHTSGLPREIEVASGPAEDPFMNFTLDAMAQDLDRHPLLFPPGTGIFYSNFGFGLLAAAASSASDRPYEEVLTETVLRRVGLEATGFAPAEGRAIMQGHDFSGAPMADAPTHEGIQGTGGLFSSADDILQWLSWHLDRFSDEDASMRQINHAAYVHRDALTPIFGMDESGRMDAMALGWVVMHGSDGRPTILQKAGGRQGMFAYTAFAPAHGIGAFAAINQFDVAAASAMAAVVNDLIADLAVR